MRFVHSTLLLFTILVSCGSLTAFADEHEFLVLLPLHGNGAEQGEACRQGFELAKDELGSAGIQIRLRYEDTGGTSTNAVSAYRAAQSRAKIPVVFSWGSSVGMALSPLANADHVIQLGVATTVPKYRSDNDYNFRLSPSADKEADYLIRTVVNKFPTASMAALYIENDYGLGSYAAASSSLTSLNRGFLIAKSYLSDTSDFRSVLTPLAALKPDLVYLASYPNDGALLLKQAREVGIRATFVSSVAIAGAKDFFSISSGAAEGLLLTTHAYDENHTFFRRLRERYGEVPVTLAMYSARAFEALYIAGVAVKNCESRKADCIRKELSATSRDGSLGHVSFDEAGDTKFQFELYRVSGEKLVKVM